SSSATISNQFGGLVNHTATLRLSLPRLPELFLEPEVHLRRRERNDVRDRQVEDKFTDRRAGGQLRFGGVFLKGFEVSAGYRSDGLSVAGGPARNREEGARVLAGATLRLDRATLDRPDFPLSGTLLTVRLEKFSGSLGGDFNYSTWQADLDRYFPISEYSTLRVRGMAALSRGPLPFQERFYLGGYNFSEG